jgi:hypothetical protein
MVHISALTVADRIQSLKYGKKVEGVIIAKLPGAVVIRLDSGKEEVVDIDRVVKIINPNDVKTVTNTNKEKSWPKKQTKKTS